MEPMATHDDEKPDERERQEAERRLEILRKEAHDAALERMLKEPLGHKATLVTVSFTYMRSEADCV
jgi:hypothetical protein